MTALSIRPDPRHGPILPPPDAVAVEYAGRMFTRQDRALPPAGFSVDWDDQPLRHKLYPGLPRRPLPSVADSWSAAATITDALGGLREDTRVPRLDVLGAVLATNAVVARRLGIDWNDDTYRRLSATGPTWARPTPSGGGMYPVESYLVSAGSASLPRGVFHYDTAHHALVEISAADRTRRIGAASRTTAPAYLIATVRFWKNSFKYNSFCYHVVGQDTGALLASWRLALSAHGIGSAPQLWFDQGGVGAALGIDPRREEPFVVLPLGGGAAAGEAGGPDRDEPGIDGSAPVRHPVIERSARTRTFPLVELVRAAGHVGSPPAVRSAGDTAITRPPDATPGTTPVALPEPPADAAALAAAFAQRESSFGRLCGARTMSRQELAGVLRTCARMAAAPVGPDLGAGPRVRTWVVVRSVAGIAPGAYAYEPGTHSLIPVGSADLGALQPRYALQNYSTGQAAALLVFSGRLPAMVAAHGGAGYRLLGIEVGQAAQAAYLAAAAAGLGIGAVLGVDNGTVDRWLDLGVEENTMLFLFLGPERATAAGYRDRIAGRAPRPGPAPSPHDQTGEE